MALQVVALAAMACTVWFVHGRWMSAEAELKRSQEALRTAGEQRLVASEQRSRVETALAEAKERAASAEEAANKADFERRRLKRQLDEAHSALSSTDRDRRVALAELELAAGNFEGAAEILDSIPASQRDRQWSRIKWLSGSGVGFCEVQTYHVAGIPSSLAFDHQGKQLAAGSYTGQFGTSGTATSIWNVRTGKERMHFRDETGYGTSMDYSRDGKWIAFTGNKVVVVNAETGTEVVRFDEHTVSPHCVSISPDGTLVASSSIKSGEGETLVWKLDTGAVTLQIPHAALCVTFSPDGRKLATSGDEIKIWDSKSGEELLTFGDRATRLAYSPDGKQIASISGLFESTPGTVTLWDAATGQPVFSETQDEDQLACVAFSPDGQHIATCGYESYLKKVKLWNVRLREGHRLPPW